MLGTISSESSSFAQGRRFRRVKTHQEMQLNPIAEVVLQLAGAVGRLRFLLPANHKFQNRLAKMAREATSIAREIDKK